MIPGKLSHLHNCFYEADRRKPHPFENLVESAYITALLEALADQMQSEFFDYDFIVYCNHALRKSQFIDAGVRHIGTEGKPKIVFFLSDETSSVPRRMASEALVVFKNMPSTRVIPNAPKNIIPFPLGCHRRTAQLPVKPIGDRKYNVFFSGQLSSKRIPLYRHLAGLNLVPNGVLRLMKPLLKRYSYDLSSHFPDSLVSFTRAFGQGSQKSTFNYSEVLYDSKIILCPSGLVHPETLRHWEALRAGCVVISQQLPETYYSTGSPIIMVKRWSEADAIIMNLIEHPAHMAELQQKSLEWYKKVCSETALARFMHQYIMTCTRVMQDA